MQVNPDVLVRSLPEAPEIMAKLTDGSYTLHGGVVRHAAGTGKGGQIVGHLLYPGDATQAQQRLQELQSTLSNGMNTLQSGMEGLQQSMNVLQGLQIANLAMSGLNLAVTTAGFVIVCRKLDRISAQIQEQSAGIAQTVRIVSEARERSLLKDEAAFRSLILSTQQFCEQGDAEHLKALIPKFHEEYQFTKLVLELHAPKAESSLERLGEISLLQDRLVNLGLGLTHVQMKCGSTTYGKASLTQLAEDINALNGKRVDALMDESVAPEVTRTDFDKIAMFLDTGKKMIPALTYQADVIELHSRRPGLIQMASDAHDILLVAA